MERLTRKINLPSKRLAIASGLCALLMYEGFHFVLTKQSIESGMYDKERIETAMKETPFGGYIAWYALGKPGRELAYSLYGTGE